MLHYLDSKDLLPHRHALLTLALLFKSYLISKHLCPELCAQAVNKTEFLPLRSGYASEGRKQQTQSRKQVRELQCHEEEKIGCFIYGAVSSQL